MMPVTPSRTPLDKFVKMMAAVRVLTILMGSPVLAQAGQLQLTEDAAPIATIVVANEPSQAASWAALDLQNHIRLISGATLPIRTDDQPVDGPAILVGNSRATRALGLSTDDLDRQEYLIRFLPNTLVVMGRDDESESKKPTPGPRVQAVGEPGWTDGKFGKALSFDGRSGLVVDRFVFPDGEGSMEAWVWLSETLPDSPGTILRINGGLPRRPQTYHIIQQKPKTRQIQYLIATDEPKTSGRIVSDELPPGWHHILATHSIKTGKIELVIDGKSQGSSRYSETLCEGSALFVGATRGNLDRLHNPFTGRIDEVRISSAYRNASEQDPSPLVEPDPPTVLTLHLDEGAGIPKALGPAPVSEPPAIFDEQATCYAVYDFLERFCGVRWYDSTDFGTDVPKNKTLIVEGQDIRRAPAFQMRYIPNGQSYDSYSGLWWFTRRGGYKTYDRSAYATLHAQHPDRPGYNLAKMRRINAFLCRQRMGGESLIINHAVSGYYNRFGNPNNPDLVAYHPEWFAQGYGNPTRHRQLCYTNPELIQQVIQDARDYFDGKPVSSVPGWLATGGNYFPLEPTDGRHFCKCESCQQLYRSDEEYTGWSTGKHSDYIFEFANKVARGIQKTHPDKYVALSAYGSHAARPKHVELEPNVMVAYAFATNRLYYDRFDYGNDMNLLKEWATKEQGRPLTAWLYYGFPVGVSVPAKGQWHVFPGYFAHEMGKQIKLLNEYGIRGIFHCGYGQEVEGYLTFKLMDDPSLDIDDLLDEYFNRYYGPAGKPLKEFYLTIERAYGDPGSYSPQLFEATRSARRPLHQTEEIAWKYLGTPDRMATLGNLMEQARQQAQTDIQKARVRLFELRTWNYMVEGSRNALANRVKREAEARPDARDPMAPKQ